MSKIIKFVHFTTFVHFVALSILFSAAFCPVLTHAINKKSGAMSGATKSNTSKGRAPSQRSALASAKQIVAAGASSGSGKIDELVWKSEPPVTHWLFAQVDSYKGPAKLKPLALVKKYELEEQYESCTSQILKIWDSFKEYQGWFALQGTQCLVSQLKTFPPRQLSLYTEWWHHLVRTDTFLKIGLWNTEGSRLLSDFAQSLWKNTQFPLSFRAEVGEVWRRWAESLNKNDRQELYKLVAEAWQNNGENHLAQLLLEREGLNNPSLASNTLSNNNGNSPNNSNGNSNNSGSNNGSNNGSTNNKKNEEKRLSKYPEEESLYLEFQEAIKQNQLTGAAEKAVRYLDKYPNGVKSTAVQDKLFQTYFNFWELSQLSDQKYSEYKSQVTSCLETVKLLHSARLSEFAKQAHRRSDFKGAYHLSKQALLMAEKSVDGAQLLFIAGRSAYFMGLYREAVEFFERMTSRHSGYVDIFEAKFRKALAWIRLNENLKAEETLAELWQDPENKTYGLSSLYWLIRIKQKRQADVSEFLKPMQERFSLTYYGLKLAAEANNQKLTIATEAKPVVIRQNWLWTPMEKKSWLRAKELAQAGWYAAAQGELNNISLSGNPEQRFLWIQQLVQIFAFPQALRLYNDLTDLEPRWRMLPYLKTIFPKPLESVVKKEAEKNELNPLLVYSLIRQESAFALAATSRSQAKGFMQLIPATANEVAQEMKIKIFDSDQMYHPITNIKFGVYYLAKVIRQFGGNVSVGLAAYNAGPQRLKKFFEPRPEVENYLLLSQEDPWSDLWMEELPWLETNFYVKSILRNRIIYQLLDSGSMDLPNPVWKDLFLGTKKSN